MNCRIFNWLALGMSICLWGKLIYADNQQNVATQKSQTDDILLIDFENDASPLNYSLDNQFAAITTNNPLHGGKSLCVDATTSQKQWILGFKTLSATIKGGGDYLVSMRVRSTSETPERSVICVMRPMNATDSSADIGKVVISASTEEKLERISFHLPINPENYSLHIFISNKHSIVLDDIKIIKEKWMGVSESIRPASMPAYPTGSSEFEVLPPTLNGKEMSAKQFGVDIENPDNTKALNDAIAYCRENKISRLTVPKGQYHFTSTAVVDFNQLTDFEFDAQGSTFIFYREKFVKDSCFIRIADCQKVLLTHFNVDWDWGQSPIATYVKVTSINKEKNYVDFQFIDYEKLPRRDFRVVSLDRVNPATMTLAYEEARSIFYTVFPARDKVPVTEWLSDNQLRIFSNSTQNEPGRYEVGALYMMRHYAFDCDAFNMKSANSHITLKNINVYSSPGMGIRCDSDLHHFQMEKFNVMRPAGSNRPISSAVDGINFSRSMGYIKLIDSEVGFNGDDCVNIHDCSCYGVKSGQYEMTVPYLSVSAQWGMNIGDPIELREDDYSPAGYTGKLLDIKASPDNTRKFIFTFDKPLPDPKNKGFILYNRRYSSSNIVIQNSRFVDNRGRGLLLLASNVTVQNNYFNNNNRSAIKIETGYGQLWAEGYGAANIVIRNNQFEKINPGGHQELELKPVIYMSVYIKEDPSREKTQYPIIQDILIQNNVFSEFPGAVAYACSAKNVIITGNTIRNGIPKNVAYVYRGAIGASYSSDIFVMDNQWISSEAMPKLGIYCDQETTQNIYNWDNKILKD